MRSFPSLAAIRLNGEYQPISTSRILKSVRPVASLAGMALLPSGGVLRPAGAAPQRTAAPAQQRTPATAGGAAAGHQSVPVFHLLSLRHLRTDPVVPQWGRRPVGSPGAAPAAGALVHRASRWVVRVSAPPVGKRGKLHGHLTEPCRGKQWPPKPTT